MEQFSKIKSVLIKLNKAVKWPSEQISKIFLYTTLR